MISQWSFVERYGRHGLHQNSLSVVFEGGGLSMNARRSLNERSTVSPVFRWSLSNLPTNATVLVNSLGHSVNSVVSQLVSQRAPMIARALNGCCWSLNESSAITKVTQRSPLISIKFAEIDFWVPQWSSSAFPLRRLLGGLRDCWEILSIFGRSMVSQRSRLCGKGALRASFLIWGLNWRNNNKTLLG